MIYYKKEPFGATEFQESESISESVIFKSDSNLSVWVIDVETDERDNFVGMSLISGLSMYYFNDLTDVKHLFANYNRGSLIASGHLKLVGHNLKGDVNWLKGWGVTVNSSDMYFDTMLASYSIDATKKSHGLKQLAKEILNLKWATYRDLVGVGKNKRTLDTLPVETVRDYCCNDCVATFRLWQHFNHHFTPSERKVFNMEMITSRFLYEMEQKFVRLNTKALNDLLLKCVQDCGEIKLNLNTEIREKLGNNLDTFLDKLPTKDKDRNVIKYYEQHGELNLNSYVQKKFILEKILERGLKSTDKKYLQQFKKQSLFVQQLADYSELFKFVSTFLKPLSEKQMVSTTYNQVVSNETAEDEVSYGIRSGRISSSNPNLQQIPVKTESGKKLRECFLSSEGCKLLICDYSQIELRVAAYFSRDKILTEAFLKDEDIHEATAKALGVERYWGKTANFLLAFGGSPYRLATALEISVDVAKDFYYKYWRTFKQLYKWKQNVIMLTRKRRYVTTLFGRKIKIENILSSEDKGRAGAERQACNYIIQGSTAEIMKLSMSKLYEQNLIPSLFVHDEFVFDVPCNLLDKTKDAVYTILMKANEMLKPIPVKVGVKIGTNWGEK